MQDYNRKGAFFEMNEKAFAPIKVFESLRQPNENGVSLLEILMAMTIFAIGMLAVATMQTTAMRGNVLSSSLTRAVIEYNQDKAEELLALNYTDAALDDGNHGPETNGIYETRWNVAEDSPFSGAKEIAITTTWKDQSGSHSVTTSVVKGSLLVY